MTMSISRIEAEQAHPGLTTVVYDQTRQYHPFARLAGDGEWIVQPPTAAKPIGLVRQRVLEDGHLEFICQRRVANGETVTFDGSHPTLFHAVSWLRWRVGVRGTE